MWNEEHCQRLCHHKATDQCCITSVDSVTEEQLLTSPTSPAVVNLSCKQLTKEDIHPCLNYVCQFLQLIITAIIFIRPEYALNKQQKQPTLRLEESSNKVRLQHTSHHSTLKDCSCRPCTQRHKFESSVVLVLVLVLILVQSKGRLHLSGLLSSVFTHSKREAVVCPVPADTIAFPQNSFCRFKVEMSNLPYIQ